MSALKIIEESIVEVQKRGIKICHDAMYVWNEHETLEACDCFGAVLICKGLDKPGFPSGWLAELLSILNEDWIWFYRFNYGFSQRSTLETYSVLKNGERKYYDDKVSKSAVDLIKRLGI